MPRCTPFSRCLRPLLALLTAGFTAAAAQPAAADDAGRPVHLVVPFAAGTTVDALGRLLAEGLAEALAVPVVVDNLPGAGGSIGVERVARAAPDGRTLVLAGDAALVLAGRYGVRPPYDTLKDLAPIAQVAVAPNLMLVNNDLPVKTLQEFLALARSQPGAFNFASAGNGTSSHRAGELLNAMAGLSMVHVPSSGNPLPDLIAGRVQLFFASMTTLPMVREGKLRALAVSSLTRSAAAPELPTLSESGLPGFEAVAWFGLLAPAGTPPALIARLEAATQKSLARPALAERLLAMGSTGSAASAAAFTRLIQDEIAKAALPARVTGVQRP